MYRGPDGDTWRTSFRHTNTIIDDNHSVLTILSGSGGTGGHSSMYLEHLFDKAGDGVLVPETRLMHLSARGGDVIMDVRAVQRMKGTTLLDMNMPKDGDIAALSRSHTTSYSLTVGQRDALLNAVDRFVGKVTAGRYRYRLPGGALGWVSTLPGKRGVNCADFIIKVMREAGIRSIGHRLIDTPKRVAE